MNTADDLGALTALASGTTAAPEVVLFESLGTVLVLGDDAGAGDVAEIVARKCRTVVFAPGIEERAFASHVTAVGRKVVAVQGHLGAFQAQVRSVSGASDIGAASPNPNRFFDVVLDLGRQPVWASPLTPLGYFAPGDDVTARAAAIEAIAGLVGRFTQPRYVVYQTELCAHGVSGFQGCTHCLDVCPAQAIVSCGNTIEVDPHLCQGCASCTLACPTGALSFKLPNREILGKRLEKVLSGYGAVAPTVVVHSSILIEKVQALLDQHGALSLPVDPLSAFGDELWLRALALGAGALVMVADPLLMPESRQTIATRVAWMHTMMPTLGMMRERLVWLEECELASWLSQHRVQARAAVDHAGAALTNEDSGSVSHWRSPSSWVRFKRLAWLDALRLLDCASGATMIAALPAQASFGEVWVNSQHCTLCFACTNLCPTHALKAINVMTQQLVFQESACVQCGLCALGCPEKAISIHARFAAKALSQMTSTVLQQDEQIACKSCGTPFIGRRLLAASRKRLAGHSKADRDLCETLLTCPACRQRGMLSVG